MDEAEGEDPFERMDKEMESDQHALLGRDTGMGGSAGSMGAKVAGGEGGAYSKKEGEGDRYMSIEEQYGIMPIGAQNY